MTKRYRRGVSLRLRKRSKTPKTPGTTVRGTHLGAAPPATDRGPPYGSRHKDCAGPSRRERVGRENERDQRTRDGGWNGRVAIERARAGHREGRGKARLRTATSHGRGRRNPGSGPSVGNPGGRRTQGPRGSRAESGTVRHRSEGAAGIQRLCRRTGEGNR